MIAQAIQNEKPIYSVYEEGKDGTRRPLTELEFIQTEFLPRENENINLVYEEENKLRVFKVLEINHIYNNVDFKLKEGIIIVKFLYATDLD